MNISNQYFPWSECAGPLAIFGNAFNFRLHEQKYSHSPPYPLVLLFPWRNSLILRSAFTFFSLFRMSANVARGNCIFKKFSPFRRDAFHSFALSDSIPIPTMSQPSPTFKPTCADFFCGKDSIKLSTSSRNHSDKYFTGYQIVNWFLLFTRIFVSLVILGCGVKIPKVRSLFSFD